MKKIVFSIVFVFATITMVNANSNSANINCVEMAHNLQTSLMNQGVPMERANAIATAAYNACVETEERDS